MALPGRKPKPRDQVRHKNPPRFEYRTFLDVPNPNPRPLPSVTELRDATGIERWPSFTRKWWKAISTLPHTIAWTDADWDYAAQTAFVHARFATGDMAKVMAELRLRGHHLGATLAARLELRITYRTEQGVEVLDDKDPAVTAMADYRKAVE